MFRHKQADINTLQSVSRAGQESGRCKGIGAAAATVSFLSSSALGNGNAASQGHAGHAGV